MAIDKEYFKNKLLEEKKRLETELEKVARKNPDNPDDWEPIPGDINSAADENIAADNIEDYSENNAIVNMLEVRYNDIRRGLEEIEKETYGICEVCGKDIEPDRLEANPAARTCKEHMG